ncbi:glycoside hydrolase family 68 protein [Caulobacter segnis]|uniref:Glycoside hydrolase family 68 n=2 Tax=Caulobacter segnis TaxID=88688 RepID=D5VEF7_CAUST|nr:glycoside hydrolase family 68 protein [Caulobacter segnis]ADG08980.1 glycoside hydrolase family 68 [Caulobacter segnis ATCC 21756]AVQ00812.1 glycoside hydrolase family 68 protein [Caulobacter segnis]
MSSVIPSAVSSEWAAPDRWATADVARIGLQDVSAAPLIVEKDIVRVAADLDIWDAWPVQIQSGAPMAFEGGMTLWMALASPRFEDPDARHGHARIHLLRRDAMGWSDLGPAMPDGFSPGSREWSGSAVLDADERSLTLYFTATGRRGEATLTFEQRLFSARATLEIAADRPRFSGWRDLREIVERDPAHYMASDGGVGVVGTIKAFRDPAYFHDPRHGGHYLFFAGSAANGAEFNGVIGAAVSSSGVADDWRLAPPLIDATEVNNELERPHVVVADGLYYMFWSTQTHVFAPGLRQAPTGLYGMVSDRLSHGWRPLNGTGLVFANPKAAPRQAYSWLVLPDLSVISFIDDWGRAAEATGSRRFGATFAPTLRLSLRGDQAKLQG